MARKNTIKAPSWLLSKDEIKIFKQILALDENEVLKKSDTLLVCMLVDAVIDFMEARQDIEERGKIITLKGDRNYDKETTNPSILIKREARKTIESISKEIGFTPKARSALELEQAEAQALSPFEIALKDRMERRKKGS
jgi:P27 family predicted phage terminase small subunit